MDHNFTSLKLQLNDDEYWDFFLDTKSVIGRTDLNSIGKTYDGSCTISMIDFRDKKDEVIENGQKIISKKGYYWQDFITEPTILKNVGYCGVDNGLIPFQRDRIDNKKFVDICKNTEYQLPMDSRLRLHKVDGNTFQYNYDIEDYIDGIRLKGGFYQGFFKTKCDEYQILPSILENGETWEFSFTLKKENLVDKGTLNEKYPNNKGIFFYIGTRAENKWIYQYDDKDDECFTLSIDDYIEDSHVDKKDYKITSFIDMSLDMPIEWESESIDDYLNFKYYDNRLYNIEDDGLEDYFYDNDNAKLIDEEINNYQEVDCWCKDGGSCSEKEKIRKYTYITCCTPCNCREVTYSSNIRTEKTCNGYLTKCEIFDLLSDLDDNDDTDYFEDDIDIRNFDFNTHDGFPLKISNQYYIDTDNKFLMFDRTCGGLNINSYKEGDMMRYMGVKNNFKGNLFLLMNRTCTGYSISTIDEFRDSQIKEYDVYQDLYENALAFRIKDNGSIGYRYLISPSDCLAKDYEIEEGYSKEGLVKENEWANITIKIKGYYSTMRLLFYLNGKLVFISKELPKINLHVLNDLDEKQETVPYNISIGGGTQGLAETVLLNYMLNPYRVYPLEENFGGSFMGTIKMFTMSLCNREFLQILNNAKYLISY